MEKLLQIVTVNLLPDLEMAGVQLWPQVNLSGFKVCREPQPGHAWEQFASSRETFGGHGEEAQQFHK